MKQQFFILMCCVITMFSCQSGKHRDSYASSASNKYKKKTHNDSYASSSGKSKSMDYHDSYSNNNAKNSVKEGRDSYSSTTSKKRSFKFWKFWKKDHRRKSIDAYNGSKKRKIIRKRKPPQGIKAS
ncbi:MAG: hypothetical protein ACJAZ2_001276 [Glaciecola sp.]|jgi:hypothetical protein